jgi:hypothetical protein
MASQTKSTAAKRRAARRNLRAMRRDMRKPVPAFILTLADGTARPCTPCTFGPGHPGHVCAFCDYPFEGSKCPNPACLTMLSAGQLAEHRAREAAQAKAEAERVSLQRSLERARREHEEHEDARRRELRAAVREAGQCEACLDHSLRAGGAPKRIKHKSPSNCPEARRHTERRSVFAAVPGI